MNPHLAVLTMAIEFPGCRSLKEKRHRVGGIRDRLSRLPNVGVCESGETDRHQHGQWTFAIIANSRPAVEKTVRTIEDTLNERVDGVVSLIDCEFL